MKKVARFEIEEVVPLSDGIVAVLTLVDEDWDELPPIVTQKCPECGEIVGDFEQHDCCRGRA